MNPFNLPGPQFLVFYMGLGLLALAALALSRQLFEAGEGTRVSLSDPYLIAYLRGGRNEALRVATVSLVDRGLLSVDGNSLKATDPAAARLVRRPIEKAMLARFELAAAADSVFTDPQLEESTDELRRGLERAGLIPDAATRRARQGRAVLAIGLLGSVAVVKLFVALARGRHNVGFLIGLAVLFAVAAWAVAHRPRTARGDALLADLRTLFGGLKERAATLRSGGATAEAVLLAAVFGLGALPSLEYAYARALYPRMASGGSASCGSSCGSSCSSGSSCGSSCGGGGGCGGCGG
jgi:uncharacterized protein (TIGR04222 family)